MFHALSRLAGEKLQLVDEDRGGRGEVAAGACVRARYLDRRRVRAAADVDGHALGHAVEHLIGAHREFGSQPGANGIQRLKRGLCRLFRTCLSAHVRYLRPRLDCPPWHIMPARRLSRTMLPISGEHLGLELVCVHRMAHAATRSLSIAAPADSGVVHSLGSMALPELRGQHGQEVQARLANRFNRCTHPGASVDDVMAPPAERYPLAPLPSSLCSAHAPVHWVVGGYGSQPAAEETAGLGGDASGLAVGGLQIASARVHRRCTL